MFSISFRVSFVTLVLPQVGFLEDLQLTNLSECDKGSSDNPILGIDLGKLIGSTVDIQDYYNANSWDADKPSISCCFVSTT